MKAAEGGLGTTLCPVLVLKSNQSLQLFFLSALRNPSSFSFVLLTAPGLGALSLLHLQTDGVALKLHPVLCLDIYRARYSVGIIPSPHTVPLEVAMTSPSSERYSTTQLAQCPTEGTCSQSQQSTPLFQS